MRMLLMCFSDIPRRLPPLVLLKRLSYAIPGVHIPSFLYLIPFQELIEFSLQRVPLGVPDSIRSTGLCFIVLHFPH